MEESRVNPQGCVPRCVSSLQEAYFYTWDFHQTSARGQDDESRVQQQVVCRMSQSGKRQKASYGGGGGGGVALGAWNRMMSLEAAKKWLGKKTGQFMRRLWFGAD